MTNARSTSDSMSARPRIIGVWMRGAAPGLREMPSSAAAAARPWPSPPPRTPRPIAKPAPAAAHVFTSNLFAPILPRLLRERGERDEERGGEREGSGTQLADAHRDRLLV